MCLQNTNSCTCRFLVSRNTVVAVSPLSSPSLPLSISTAAPALLSRSVSESELFSPRQATWGRGCGSRIPPCLSWASRKCRPTHQRREFSSGLACLLLRIREVQSVQQQCGRSIIAPMHLLQVARGVPCIETFPGYANFGSRVRGRGPPSQQSKQRRADRAAQQPEQKTAGAGAPFRATRTLEISSLRCRVPCRYTSTTFALCLVRTGKSVRRVLLYTVRTAVLHRVRIVPLG